MEQIFYFKPTPRPCREILIPCLLVGFFALIGGILIGKSDRLNTLQKDYMPKTECELNKNAIIIAYQKEQEKERLVLRAKSRKRSSFDSFIDIKPMYIREPKLATFK